MCTEESYADDCLKLREMDPEGKEISLRNGWHSKWFKDDCGVERLNELMGGCHSYANQAFIEDEGFHIDELYRDEWWVNIGGRYSYNNIHVHGRATLIGIFFVKVPEGSGDLVLQRNDGAPYSSIYNYIENGNQISYYTERESFLIFYRGICGTGSISIKGDQERISISVNYY